MHFSEPISIFFPYHRCCDKEGRTPLHLAADRGLSSVVNWITMKVTDLDVQTQDKKYTPMHMAAMNGHTDCMMVRLRRGHVSYRAQELILLL